MSVNIPPNPNVSTFNNLYWITGDTPLTENIANKKYLKFPVAQGNETLQGISVNGIATFNSTSTFNDDATFNEPVIIADGANNSTISQTTSNLVIQDNAVSGEIDFNTANSSGVITTQLSLNKSKGATFTTNTYVEDSVFVMRDNDTTTTQNNTSYNAGTMIDFNLAPVSLNPVDRYRFYSDALGNTIDPLTISRTGISVNPSITFPDGKVQNSAFTGAGALAGSYTASNITLDTNGKITAISNGTAPPPPTPTLAQVLTAGNSAGSSSINMNFNNITNAGIVSTLSNANPFVMGGFNAQVGVCARGILGSTTTPIYMETIATQITGNASSIDIQVNLNNNYQNSINYMVFPSVYYGFAGSGGTYNAQATANALNQFIIYNRTTSNFRFYVSKTTGNNVNIYLTFLVIYNSAGTDYPASY